MKRSIFLGEGDILDISIPSQMTKESKSNFEKRNSQLKAKFSRSGLAS